MINFNQIVDGEAVHMNYNLRTRKVNLKATITPIFETPDGGRWEDDGGFVAPPYEVDLSERYRAPQRAHHSRKQMAAKRAIPRESIKVVNKSDPAPVEVAAVRMNGGSIEDEKVAMLEAQIRKLMGLLPQVK